MTLEEAIKHAEEVADFCEYEVSKYDMSDSYECHLACQEGECAEEHRQLAEWLKELKELRKQKETIIDRLSEKFAYLNTCPNERDMIIRIVGGTSGSEIHCDTDCNHTDCKSYHFGFNVKKDKYE